MSSGFTTPARTGEEGIEFAHLWKEGDGRRMVEAVLSAFRERHPEVDVRDRGYENHGLAVKGRILQGDPPPLFAEWPDQALRPYIEAGAIRDLTEVWEDNGWTEAFLQGSVDRCTVDGRRYAVPLNIHRMNNLFYDVELVERYGVDPADLRGPRELLSVMRQFDEEGFVGMHQPMKNPNTVLTLWAHLLLGEYGMEPFEGVTGGSPGEWQDEIAETVRLLGEFADLAADDAYFLDMVGTNGRFPEGDSPFYFMGDWVAGEYLAMDDFDHEDDWDRVAFPGTEDMYVMSIDAVAAAADAPFGEGERALLEFLGSRQALEGLNRIKGAIPPRSDVSLDDYPLFLRSQFKDFHRAHHYPGSHAIQVPPHAFIEAQNAFSEFVADRNVAKTTTALVEAYQQ